MKLKDLENVLQKVGSEGFDYCFREYSSFKEVKDKTFHELREAYVETARYLEDYLREEAEKNKVEYEELLG